MAEYKATFPLAHPLAPPGAPPAAPALRSQRRPLDGGGWPCGLVLGDGLPARLGLLGGGDDFAGHPSTNVVTEPGKYDGFPCHAALSIGPYSVLIFSQ